MCSPLCLAEFMRVDIVVCGYPSLRMRSLRSAAGSRFPLQNRRIQPGARLARCPKLCARRAVPGSWRGRSGVPGGLGAARRRRRPGATARCDHCPALQLPAAEIGSAERYQERRDKFYGGLYLRTRLAVAMAGGGPWRGRSGGAGGLWARVEGRGRPGATVCYPVHAAEQAQRAVDRGEKSRTTVSGADCRE